MSKARELAELGAVYDSGALSNRNFIINGAMQVWQRGTTSSNNSYGADRWRGTSVTSQAQSTDVPNASFAYSNAASGSGGSAGGIGTPIELQVTGKSAPFKQNTKYTFSGYFKGTSGQKLQLRLRYRDGMFGANSQEILASTDIVTFDGTWQYVTKTVDFGSSVDVVGTSKCLELLLIHNTADATWYQTGCQFELGTEATPFEHRSFGDELARCQRYYYRHVNGDNQFIGGGDMYTTSQLNANIDFPTAMRAFPSLVAASGTNYYIAYGAGTSTDVTNSWNLFKEHTNAATIYVTPTSTVTAGSGMRVITSSASGSIAFDAEL